MSQAVLSAEVGRTAATQDRAVIPALVFSSAGCLLLSVYQASQSLVGCHAALQLPGDATVYSGAASALENG